MGWNQVRPLKTHPLFRGVPETTSFYFVHSYFPEPADASMRLAETEYMITFTSAIVKDNLCAVQFHPEKSGRYGLLMLNNFLGL